MNESGDGPDDKHVQHHMRRESSSELAQHSRVLSAGWTMRVSPQIVKSLPFYPILLSCFLRAFTDFIVISTRCTLVPLGEKRNPATCKYRWNSNSEQNTNTPSQTSLGSCRQEWHRWVCSSHCQAEESGSAPGTSTRWLWGVGQVV